MSNMESLNRKDLKNKFNNYNFITLLNADKLCRSYV